MVKKVQDLYDAIALEYDTAFQDALSLAENAFLFSKIPYASPDRIIDIGCGTGLALDYLAPAPANYLGIDLSAGMLMRAKEHHPAFSFLEGDMQDLSMILSGHADLVLCLFGVLNLAQDMTLALSEIARILHSGGRLALITTGRGWSKMKSHHPHSEELRRMLTFPTVKQMQALLAAQGFQGVRRVSFHSTILDSLSSPFGRWEYGAALTLEAATVGRWAPDACAYHLFLAQKGGRRDATPAARL